MRRRIPRSKRSKVAIKGERPTTKVEPKANKRRLTNNQYGITTQIGARSAPYELHFGFSPSKAKDQPRKLNQNLTSESLQISSAASSRRVWQEKTATVIKVSHNDLRMHRIV
ncbi:hypothetical protein CXF72_06375 [Psychromonas sp. MB-3u-54]|nr:hypothetical protein CXF72_06375 [Psychromonas sp. MB-3u-54]